MKTEFLWIYYELTLRVHHLLHTERASVLQNAKQIDTRRQVGKRDFSIFTLLNLMGQHTLAQGIEQHHTLHFLTFNNQLISGRIGMHGKALITLRAFKLMVLDGIFKEMNMERQLVAIFTDVGNLKAFLRRAIVKIRMRIGVGAKCSATCGVAEMRTVQVTILDVAVAIGTENPILMRYSVVVEKAIGEHTEIIERDGIVPTRHDKSGTRDAFFIKILFVTILQHIPLGTIDGRFDVINVSLDRTTAV